MTPSRRISGLPPSRLLAFLRVIVAVVTGVLVSAGPASAQSLAVLHTFASQGAINPAAALILATDGNFYGTSSGGLGSVFKMTPGGTLTILHAFTGGPADGAYPYAALIQATNGNFYGTTAGGGTDGEGTVFTMSLTGTVTILHSFNYSTEGVPYAGLIQGTDGDFYGTTEFGGPSSSGAVFKVTPGGTLTVLYAFTGGATDGAFPYAALIQGTDGNFYGTTFQGGPADEGTVFEMTSDGIETIVYAFTGAPADGAYPGAGLIQGTDGNFYGTTAGGGTSSAGTVFKMAPGGTLTIVYAFTGGTTDGALPFAALIQATDGNFYGTTSSAGTWGEGTVFKVTPGGVESILHAFTGGTTDGASPTVALIQATDGSFYGTTEYGTTASGPSSAGTVFQITPGGTVTILQGLTYGTDGAFSYAGLIQASDGNFYGTTEYGGIANEGTVFKMTLGGTLTILHAFTGGPADGAYPEAALIQGTNGIFYGTTSGGGFDDAGTVFTMTLSGTVTILHSFDYSTEGDPYAGLIQGKDGNFYGTTEYGSSSSRGAVFEMTPGGALTILYAFTGGASDGAHPDAALIQATDGNFYGTTTGGGTADQGTVFKMSPGGSLTILYAFTGGTTDGAGPYGALIQTTDGNFYGTTASAGTSGGGTIFKMTPSGTETILHAFNYFPDGANPAAALIRATDGNFYGTSFSGGGARSAGTVFTMTRAGAFSVLYSFTGGADGASPFAGLIQAADGNFYGTTSSGGASGTGDVFRLIVPPTITTQVMNRTVMAGKNPQFVVAASGGPAPTYQWQISTNGGLDWSDLSNGSLYSGATTATLTVSDATQGLSGTEYRCVATNSNGSATSSAATLRVVPSIAPGDFDGDAKTDPSLYFRSTGQWWILYSSTGYATNSGPVAWGGGNAIPVPGDYDGDGKSDPAVYFPATGQWWILYSSTGYTSNSGPVSWGGSDAIPVPGDYDGDGRTDPALYFPSTGQWWILYSSTGYMTNSGPVPWGGGGVPVPGDYDGDGKTDPALYFPSTGQWWILYSSTGYTTNSGPVSWGGGGAIPVPGDYDGDGKIDPALYFPSTGQWWILYSSTDYTTNSGPVSWGGGGAIPVPGDYDGDGKIDPALYFPSTGQWWILYSSTGYTTNSGPVTWGGEGDIPVLAAPTVQ